MTPFFASCLFIDTVQLQILQNNSCNVGKLQKIFHEILWHFVVYWLSFFNTLGRPNLHAFNMEGAIIVVSLLS